MIEGAYRAKPNGEPRGLILVVHEIFGLTPHIKSLCDRLAALGYVAVAPDLYREATGGACLPYTDEGKSEGLRLKAQFTEEGLLAKLASALAAEPVGLPRYVLGFCLGGTLTWMAAASLDIDAAVGYYAVGLRGHLTDAPQCPVLLHFGLSDQSVPQSEVDAVARAFPEVEIHRYDAGHAFNRDDDKAYEPTAATTAWERTITFLTVNRPAQKAAH